MRSLTERTSRFDTWSFARVRLRAIAVGLGAVLALGAPSAEAAKKPKSKTKIDAALTAALEADDARRLRVIVKVKPGQRKAVLGSLVQHGDVVAAEHGLIDAVAAEVHADDVAALADSDAVASVSIDAPVTSHAKAKSPKNVSETGSNTQDSKAKEESKNTGEEQPHTDRESSHAALVRTLGLFDLHQTGAGVGIAFIDSGINATSDLASSRLTSFDVSNGVVTSGSARDLQGHGTHIASLAAGKRKSNGDRRYGVAPDVRLIAFRVLDGEGRGHTSDVIAAIEYAVANRTALGIDIINLSLGHPIFEPASTDPLVQAVEEAVAAGIVVVVAAGNYGSVDGRIGYAGIASPGNAPSAITVGALMTQDTQSREDDRVAPYSSSGPTWLDGLAKPDVVAPGHRLTSSSDTSFALYQQYPQNRVTMAEQALLTLSGTSMAAGVTSGVVALMIEASRGANPGGPALTPNAIKAVLQFTSFAVLDDFGYEYDTLRQGAGALNAEGAVTLAAAIRTSAPLGASWLASPVSPCTKIGGDTLPWTQRILWGNEIATGESVYTNEEAWSRNLVWGSARNLVWGSARNLVWSNDVVWSAARNLVWSNNIVWADADLTVAAGQSIPWGLDLEMQHIVWSNTWSPAAETGSFSFDDPMEVP